MALMFRATLLMLALHAALFATPYAVFAMLAAASHTHDTFSCRCRHDTDDAFATTYALITMPLITPRHADVATISRRYGRRFCRAIR